jgi:hypothetical protein
MPFYNCVLGKKGAARVIDDTFARLGKAATIKLLDDLMANLKSALRDGHLARVEVERQSKLDRMRRTWAA